jgi:hypothetical protein
VRQITRPENPLSTVTDAVEPPESSGHGASDVAGPPTELTPRENWVPAEDVFSGSVNENPIPENTNDNQTSEMTVNNETTDESSTRVTFDDPVSREINEGSNESPLPATSSTASYSTAPSYASPQTPGEEIYRLRQIEDPRGTDWEVFDLPKTSTARIYQYYICRAWKLKVLCDQGKEMTDLPVHSKEDYGLLRTLTRTNWNSKWWTIMIEDLICPECVSLLKARRKDPKSKCQKTWLRIKSKIRRVCLCGNNSHGLVSHHTRTDMNKVTRFFHALGEINASHMVNIEFDTDPRFQVDVNVLASAAYNTGRYFKDAQRFSIKFHFHETAPIERERIEGIVCSLAKLEAILPWAHKLHVAGFEDHNELKRAWAKKSRARKR